MTKTLQACSIDEGLSKCDLNLQEFKKLQICGVVKVYKNRYLALAAVSYSLYYI